MVDWYYVDGSGALVVSNFFLLRSLLPLMSAQKEKATTVVGLVCAMLAIFMLVVKFKFYSNTGFDV